MTMSRTIRLLLLFAGGVNLWTVATADLVLIQVGAGIVAAIVLVTFGLLWERSVPTLADSLAYSLFGTETASEGLVAAAAEIVRRDSAEK